MANLSDNTGVGSSLFTALENVTNTAVAQGEVIYYNGTDWANLGVGAAGQVLSSQGAGANPQWIAAGGGTGVVAMSSYEYDSTTTEADPGAGKFRLDASPASAVFLYISNVDKTGIDMGAWLLALASGKHIRLGQTDDSTAGELYTIGAIVDNTTWAKIALVHVDSGTSSLTNAKVYGLQFEPGGGGGGSSGIYQATELDTFAVVTPGDAPDFTSIAAGYDKLTIEYSAAVDDGSAGSAFRVIVNGDATATNYHSQRSLANNGSGLTQEAAANTICLCAGDSLTTLRGTGTITVYDYDQTDNFKQFVNVHGDTRSTSDLTVGTYACTWDTTNTAINRIQFDDGSSNGFAAGSWFKIYGWKTTA